MTRNSLILDGDLFLYRASAAVQKTFKFAGPEPAISADFCAALNIFDRSVADVRRALDASEVLIALSDPRSAMNYRRQILPSYKASRKETPKPILYKKLRQEIESRFETRCFDFLEADDLQGIYLTTPGHPERVAVGWDGDMMTVPGRHYNPHHPELGIVEVTVEQADRFHLIQTLAGDRVDGYYGIPGVGEIKAAAILDAEVPKGLSPWGKVVAAYRRAGLTEADALVQARVAFILRHGYYNKYVGVQAWTPPEQQETT